MQKLALSVAVGFVIALFSTPTRADDRSVAREHYQKGTKLFDLGQFDDAIREYEAAYQVKDDPVLLYNIAQAHRLAGHHERAIFFYKSFLRRMPKAPNREDVMQKIADLQKQLDHLPAPAKPVEPEPTPTPTPTPAPAPDSRAKVEPVKPGPKKTGPAPPGQTLKIAGFALIGVGALGLIGGAAAAGLSAKYSSDAVVNGKFNSGAYNSGLAANNAAYALFAVGGAAIIAGGVCVGLGYKDEAAAKKAKRVLFLPQFGPGYAGASLSLNFY